MQSHEQWLFVAIEDLKAARALLKVELFSSVAFHCQQCAEKALKGYLVFRQHSVRRTHDLIQLLELCLHFEKNFQNFLKDAENLNPFATKFRYPPEYDIPDYADAKEAVGQARRILQFVQEKISELGTGQMSLLK